MASLEPASIRTTPIRLPRISSMTAIRLTRAAGQVIASPSPPS